MSSHKRRGEDDRNQHARGDKRRRRRNRKHLYLVLDDWKKGFSIHKIEADSFDHYDSDYDSEEGHGHHSGAARHLPEPPALRLEPPTGDESHSSMSFAALGAKIFAFMNQRCGLVYDAETAVLSVGAPAPAQMYCGLGISIAVGEVLYVLSYRYFDRRKQPYSFEAMSWGPTGPDARQEPTEGWLWKTLPPPPFTRYIHSYALHPDGRTIFVTSSVDKDISGGMGTYSFDITNSAWKFHGSWVLPFKRQGYFDSELDAWVGLNWDGYMCSCPVISPSFSTTAPCFYPDCKMTEDRMFCESDRASLTYMGANKFCLVKCVGSNNVKKRPIYGARDGFVIHLTMFGLKYNHRGELQIKDHRSTRSFAVSRHRYCFVPHAFWM
jgi:hypothetical protein